MIVIKQEAPLSPRDPRDALYHLKHWPTVVRITQTDRVSAWEALSAIATFYSATCIDVYKHRCTRLGTTIAQRSCNAVRVIYRLPRNQSYWCQNWTVTVVNQRRLPPVLLTSPRLTPPAPAHRRGRKSPWRINTKVSNSKSDLRVH